MAWEPYQRVRLAQERKILAWNMPDFQFHDLLENTYIEGDWRSSQRTGYRIRIELPPGFPDECPHTYILRPVPLDDWKGQPLTSYGTHHGMHLWETDKPPYVKICTYRPAMWSIAHTLEQVVQKALLWIEAYEAHLTTRDDIACFLATMPDLR